MKMMSLMLIILVLISSTYVLASDLIRWSGSNSNTVINSVEILPYNTPNFGENLTIRANVTDNENDRVIWVNFSILHTTGGKGYNLTNGTQFNDYWNSTRFLINETGTWRWNITSNDNDTSNTSLPYKTDTFTITDTLTHLPDDINTTIPINYNFSQIVKLFTSTRKELNFTLGHTLDQNFTTTFNQTYIIVNTTEYSEFNITIKSNASSIAGKHTGNLTITRNNPYHRVFTIPIEIFISSDYGDIEFTAPSDITHSNYCPATTLLSKSVINNGNYEMTDCKAYLYNSTGGTVNTGSAFTLGAGASGTATLNYGYTGGTVELWMNVQCTASPGGSTDKALDSPKVTFTEASDCGAVGPGGPSYAPPPPIKEPEAITEIKEMPICGNGVCQAGETPLNCPQDCPINVEELFCWIFDIGKCPAWVFNYMVYGILGTVMLVTYRKQKGKPIKFRKWK